VNKVMKCGQFWFIQILIVILLIIALFNAPGGFTKSNIIIDSILFVVFTVFNAFLAYRLVKYRF
jgi:hypothetical protein